VQRWPRPCSASRSRAVSPWRGLNLGGSIEPIHNPIDVVELALEKGAATILMPVSCRRPLVDLSDEAAAKVQGVYYLDAANALRGVRPHDRGRRAQRPLRPPRLRRGDARGARPDRGGRRREGGGGDRDADGRP
jgi:hypothetical protein